jgi:hypothetical protein
VQLASNYFGFAAVKTDIKSSILEPRKVHMRWIACSARINVDERQLI